MPGEFTFYAINYGKHTNFNSHWFFRVYGITKEEALAFSETTVSEKIFSMKDEIRKK